MERLETELRLLQTCQTTGKETRNQHQSTYTLDKLETS